MIPIVKTAVVKRLDAWHDRYAAQETTRVPLSLPCLALRHDMDGMDGEWLRDAHAFERTLGVPATCFFLLSQIERDPALGERFPGWDIQLHSEARPRAFVTITRSTPKYGTLLTQRAYARNLERQVQRAARAGLTARGHSVHGIHQYLDVDSEWSWNIIERATCVSTLSWMSSSRAVYDSAPLSHRPLLPPYEVRHRDRRLVVFPTAFADASFFHRWWEDRLLDAAPRTEEHARDLLTGQAEECISRGIPLVVNFHPWWWFTDRADGRSGRPRYSFALVEWLVRFYQQRGLDVVSLSTLYDRITRGVVAG